MMAGDGLCRCRDRVAEMIKDRSGTGIDSSVRLCKIGREGRREEEATGSTDEGDRLWWWQEESIRS